MTVRPQHPRAELVDADTVRLRLRVDNLAGVMATYDRIVVSHADAKAGTYSDFVGPITLLADTHEYTYIDLAGSAGTWYRARYSDGAVEEGDDTAPVAGNGGGNYATIEQVRDEGFPASMHDDARVLEAIQGAEEWLKETTRRRFFPEQLSPRFDGSDSRVLPLYMPIVQIDAVDLLSADWPVSSATTVELDTIRVYNRHLTQHLPQTDDRNSAKLELPYGSRWPSGRQNVRLTGWFGYTKIGRSDEVGETSDGSQIPLSRGQVPQDITRLVVRLAIRRLPQAGDPDEVEFWTDRHRVSKYKTRSEEVQLLSPRSAGGLIGQITGDSHLDDIISKYCAPATGRMV